MAKIDTNKPFLIEKLSTEGRGIAYPEGKITFVLGALPEEQIMARILRKRKKIMEAVAIQVVGNPHSSRVEPICKHFLQCGGCTLQHMHPSSQIDLKNQHFQELWCSSLPEVPLEWMKPLVGPNQAYRRKARLGLKYVHKKNKLLLGFREQDGRKVLDMEMCQILTSSITEHLFKLQQCLVQTSIAHQIPQIEISSGDEAVAVIIRHLIPFSTTDLTALEQFSSQTNWQLFLQSKGPETIKPLLPKHGLLSYKLTKENVILNFHPADFVQVNAKLNESMIDQALSWLEIKQDELILDLFCGLGNFSIPVAKRGAKVIGVEGSMEMVIRATSNATQNQLEGNCQFFAQDLEAKYFQGSWVDLPYTKVLLDPPRSGATTCISWLITKRPQRIVYVSCHPSTLIRDAEILLKAGYTATKAGLMDMFPHTQHVEAMVCFDDGRL